VNKRVLCCRGDFPPKPQNSISGEKYLRFKRKEGGACLAEPRFQILARFDHGNEEESIDVDGLVPWYEHVLWILGCLAGQSISLED
jgi:hypothetical protein